MTPIFILALLLAAAPAPSPRPLEEPLREIGRVRVLTGVCGVQLARANQAIVSALHADTLLVLSTRRLREISFDYSVFSKSNGIREITKIFVDLRAEAKRGEGEVSSLRETIKVTTDPARAAELKSFADALAGALSRQRKLADNLGTLIAWLDAHDRIPVDETRGSIFYDPPDSLSYRAKAAADEIDVRMVPLTQDEQKAADHAGPALDACIP
jgi:hypothetical protein